MSLALSCVESLEVEVVESCRLDPQLWRTAYRCCEDGYRFVCPKRLNSWKQAMVLEYERPDLELCKQISVCWSTKTLPTHMLFSTISGNAFVLSLHSSSVRNISSRRTRISLGARWTLEPNRFLHSSTSLCLGVRVLCTRRGRCHAADLSSVPLLTLPNVCSPSIRVLLTV